MQRPGTTEALTGGRVRNSGRMQQQDSDEWTPVGYISLDRWTVKDEGLIQGVEVNGRQRRMCEA